jgi:hypothetical protein
MSLSKEVRGLLQQGREEAVVELAVTEPRALRPLMGRLWDPEEEIRRRATHALGRGVAAHPELGVEVVRRLMWALNDESATNGVHAIPALGEIGRRSPETLAPFVPPLVSMTTDSGLRLEILRALTVVAEHAPQLVAAHLDRLASTVDRAQPEERRAWDGLAAATRVEARDDD